jgi:hypothetical protein
MKPVESKQIAHSATVPIRANAPTIFECSLLATVPNDIDKAVQRHLKRKKIKGARPCSDAVFLRRAFLDVTGTLPSLAEVKYFLHDTHPKKRSELIDQLLERKEFAAYWGLKWGDLLRVKAEFPINLWPNATQAYDRWIRDSIREKMPYDQFARELLMSSGSNFRVPPVNFYRALQSETPQDIARMVALTFMGTRVERWPQDRIDSMTVFFSYIGFKSTQEWKEQVIFFDSVKAANEASDGAFDHVVFPDGRAAKIDHQQDPREAFANWLISPDNEFFARSIANRAWYWLFGRGVVHEPDDLHEDNPASNPELLTLLEKKLVASNYDLTQLFRYILNSQTYQQSSIPLTDDPHAESNFAFYPLRQLDAEVLIDALCGITGTTEEYSSVIPEPFTFIPGRHRSIELPDGSITSSFLETFGRPPRDTGMEAERNCQPSSAQRLHLLNSSHIRNKIEQSGNLKSIMSIARKRPVEAVKNLYLTILSRYPTREELAIVTDYNQTASAKNRGLMDLVWALINSSEFLFRH